MATSEEILRVKLLDAKKAETELKSVRRELEKTTGATKDSGKASVVAASSHEHSHKVLGALKNTLAYGGGLLGISAVGYGLKDLVQGGIKAQEQQLLLQNALRATGQTGRKHIGELNTAVSATTGAGGFSALEETEGLANFVRLTKSSEKAVKDNQLAITLARGAHESYGTALMQVSRIQTGQVGRLQRYLGIIQPVKYYENQLTAEQKKRFPEKLKEAQLLDKEATAREANRRILERYGGAVQAYNKSTAGSISNANNAFKNATEQLGLKLLPAVTAVAKGFSHLISEVSKGEGPFAAVVKDFEKVFKVLGNVYDFLKGHPELAKMLGYVGITAGAAHELKKVPGVSLAGKILKTVASPTAKTAEAGAVGAGGLSALSASLLAAGTVYGGYVVGKTAFGGNLAEPFGNPYGSGGLAPGEHRNNLRLLQKEKEIQASGVETRGKREERELLQEAVERGMANSHSDVHMDGHKVGQVIRRNPRASREVAEGVTAHAQKRNARG